MSLFEPLPKVDFKTWFDAVESDLGDGAITRLGSSVSTDLDVAPLYSEHHGVAESGLPGTTPGAIGSGPCRVGCRASADDLEAALAEIEAARRAGVSLLWLEAAESVMAETGAGSRIRAACLDPESTPDAEPLSALILEVETALTGSSLVRSFGEDIESSSARLDITFAGDAERVDLARWCHDRSAGGPDDAAWRSILVNTEPHRAAGADAVDELAAAIVDGIDGVRGLVEAGIDTEAAVGQIQFAVTVGRDVFLEIAKLRALRRLWWRATVALVAGRDSGAGQGSRRASILATTPRNERTVYGPFVNQLRATAETFAAQVGGADALVLAPFDLAVFDPAAVDLEKGQGALGARLVATTQHVAAEEAHLGRVGDPAAGSYYIESMTDRLAREAWRRMRSIERSGGLDAVIEDGSLAARYARSRDATREAVRRRRDGWIGSNLFANLDEGPSAGSLESTFGPRPTAELERVRRAVDRLASAGARPRAEILGFGAPAVVNAQSADAGRALAAGGIDSVAVEASGDTAARDVTAPRDASAARSIVVLCGDPEALDRDGPAVARNRISRGDLVIVGAASLSDAWSAIDVERLHPDCDLVALLTAVARHAGAELEAGDG